MRPVKARRTLWAAAKAGRQVSAPAQLRLWGLTGGIASGKSTVAQMLRAASVPTLDADATYHRLLQPLAGAPSPLARALAAAFGPTLLSAKGEIDRAALGERIFGAGPHKAAARQQLEALTHPAIAQDIDRQVAQLVAAQARWAVYDVPLLFERGSQARFAGIVVVWVPYQVQLARLMQRNGLDELGAQRRLATQASLDAKRVRASWIIDNRGPLSATERQVMVWVAAMRASQGQQLRPAPLA